MDFSFKKQALLEALEARRPWAAELDRKQTQLHKAAEKEALNHFRSKCREAVKWSYDEAKKQTMYTRAGRDWFEPPSCPTSIVQMLDAALEEIRRDGRQRYQISHRGGFHRIHYLLSYDENAKPDVCT
jgi:hypothetical protein